MQKRTQKEKPRQLPKRKSKMSRFQDVSSLIARIKKETPNSGHYDYNLPKNSISNSNPEESPNINPKTPNINPKSPKCLKK